MRRLRVVTLIDILAGTGGAERIAAEIATRLDPERFERTICAARRVSGPPAGQAREAGVRIICLERGSKASLRPWWTLVSLLRREQVDILHAHKFGSNVWGTTLGRLAAVPVVIAHEHTWSYEGQPLRRLLDRHLVARWADAFVAVSREDRRRMIEVEGIPPDATRFIPNGIPPLAEPSGHDVRAELGIPADAPVIGTLGVLRRQKALDVLVRAAGVLAPQFPGLRVLIGGSGPDRERLEAQVRAAGLEETVLLLGLRHDVPDVLAALDVAVSSSDFEGSPLAVMEYMAAGKAIVATAVGGVPDLVVDGRSGLLVPRRDAQALAAAVAELLRDPARRAAFGATARDHQRREFDIDVTVARVAALYEELVAARSRKEASLSR